MAKKKLVGDPFFPDAHLDIPDFEYDIPPPKNDRNPTVKVAKAAVKGAISSFKDSAFIKRLLRESLPPVYGEIDDLRSQAQTGIKKLYNSAAKEIKPSLNELSRSVEKLVPNERKKIKAAVNKLSRWTTADGTASRSEADESDQREKNIALELGRIFSSQSEQQQAISIEQRSEERAERRVRDAIDFNRHKDSLGALNQISTSVQGLDSYQTRVTSQYQKKSLELQMRSYWLATDAFKQQKKDAERMTAELTAITKNTALPEFVKLKQNEAWREHVRNRFINDASTGLSAGLFGKRANFVGNFFNNIGRTVKDKATEAAGVFSQAAMGAEAAGMVGEMNKGTGGSAKESVAGLAGSVGAQTLALKAGRKVREKIEANPRANKAVKDLEYNVRNVPQALSKYANTDKYDDGLVTRALKGVLRAGMGSLSPDMRMQTDSLLNSDPNNANGLRAGAQFNNQNSKSLNEIIPGYLARIFRELQVIRTGDNKIGLTTYDFTKNRFLDSGKVSRNILKTLTGDVSKQAHQERVDRIMETIGADKELDESTRKALAEALTKENFKGTKLDPEFLTKSSSYSKNDKIKKNADKIAALFKKYFGVKGYDQDGKPIMANDLETSEKINNINKEMGRLGMDFNDARVVIQELINIGQYQELRNIGILDEDKRSVDMNKLIELYSYGSEKPKSFGVGGRNVFSTIAENSSKSGGQQTINNYQQKTSDGLGGKGKEEITKAMQQFGSKIDDLVKVTSESKNNDYSTNASSSLDKIAEYTKTTNDILTRIQNVLDERLKIVINRMPAGDESGGLRGKLQNIDMAALRAAAGERLDTISGSAKNIYNKTIGRGLNMIKPVTSSIGKLNKFWWNSTAKPLAKGVAKTAGIAGRVATDQILKIRDIYIDGENEPRLLVAKLKAGQYFNAKTGEVIRKIHEIKDGVRDAEGNMVLTVEEVSKAYTRNAKGGVVSVAKELFSNVFSGIGKFQGFMHRTITIPAVRAALAITKGTFTLGRNLFDQATDIYVKGESEPTLLAITMRAGGYVSKVSKKVITRPSQIDGPVLDKDGNIVLSDDMLKKGIVDKNGRSVGSPLANFGRFIGAGVRTAFNVARKVTGGINNFFNGALGKGGEMLGDIFSKFSNALGGGKSYDVLVEIKNLLDKRLPQAKAKNKFLDLDGDGIRDGSTQDILKKRGENKGDKERGLDKDNLGGVVDSGRENTIDRITNGVGSVKDKIKDWMGMGDGVDVDIDGDKRRKRRKRKVRMGRAAQAAKKVGGAGLEAGKSIAGRAAGTAAGGAIGKAATTAAGGLSSAAGGLGSAAMTAGGFLARNALKVAGGVGTAYGLYSAYDNASKGNYGSAALDLGLAGVSGAAMLGGTAGLAGLGSAALTAGGAVLSGAAALFSAPVVLSGLAIAGAAYGGYKLYKYLTKPNMKPLSRLRMAQYGFGTDDADYLGKVQAFEKEMRQYVRFDEDKAKLEIDDEKASKLISFFDFQAQDRDQLNNWMMWVQKRFKPVFLTHMTALKSMGKEDSLFSVDELETEIQSKYLNMVKFPDGPYTEMASPFPGLKKLEVGSAVVKYVTKLADEEIAKKLEEDKNKKKGTLEAGAAAAATTAESARSKLGLNDNKDDINAAAIDKANESMLTKFARGVKDSILSVPILKVSATALTIIGKTAGKWMGFGVEADEAVRFKTYGLIEMDRLKVIGLRNLEEYMAKNIKFNSDGSAKWEGSLADALNECKADFGISSKTDEQAKAWMKWFGERFSPTYLAYMSYLRQATGKDKQSDCEKSLKPEDRADIAAKVAAMDVWSKTTSPWRDYKLSTDATSVKVNIQLLDSQSKDSKLNEKKSAASKPSTGLAAALNKDPSKKDDAAVPATPAKPATPSTGLGGATGAPAGAAGGVAAVAAAPDQEGETKPPAQSAVGQPAASGAGSSPGKSAGGPLRDGSGADKSITFYKNAKLNGVNPAVLKLFKGMVEEYAEKTGKTVRVNDGFRTFEEQKALHEKDPKKAAAPGRSLHESGLAIDIDSAVADEMEKMGLMRKYGFTRPIGGEPWHLEPSGIQMDRKGAVKDSSKAEQLVNASPGKGGGGWGTNPNAGKYSRNDGLAKSLFEEGNGATTVAEQEMAGLPVSKVNGSTNDIISRLKERGMGTGGAGAGGAGGSTGLNTPAGDAVTTNKDTKPGTALGYGNTPAGTGKSGYAAVKDTIAEASKLVGVDEKTMVTKAALESSFNPNAKAGTSNASGLYQFVPGTWNEMMAKYGKRYGIPPGTPPTDVRANAILAAQYMKDNESTLSNAKGGGAINGTDRYMAHFFGPGGASQMIKADPNATAASVLPKAAASNRETFYDANGRPRTVAEVRSFLDKKVNSALKNHGIDESQFGNTTAVAQGPADGTAQQSQGNPNIVKASFNPASTSTSPIALPANRVTPEAIAAKEREKQRMALNDALKPAAMSRAPQLPEPMQVQQRMDSNLNTSGPNKIMSDQLTVQKEIATTLKDILGKMDFTELKNALANIAGGAGGDAPKSKAEEAAMKQGTPGKSDRPTVDRTPSPIGFSRMT